jgi:transcriptional regulator GlxA family with amidase domain
MAQVRKLLSGTRLSHREIARSCGYKSESYMEHVFVKRFGRSMRDFRNSGEAPQ